MRQGGFHICCVPGPRFSGRASCKGKNNPTTSSTSTIEQNLPCSYCMFVVERDNPEPLHFDVYTGHDCMERFF